MRAIAVIPGTKTVRLVDRPEPSIAGSDEIKLRVLRVGICGTDREEAAGGRAKAPPSYDDLVLGHEMFGQVADVGRAVTKVAPTMDKDQIVMVNLSGRGDKDVHTVAKMLGMEI